LNKSDEDKYTFENPNTLNVKNEDNFDLDEFINEENKRIQKRITDLSTTNVSFFNINKDEVLNLDYNHFLKGNLDETNNNISNRHNHHSNSVSNSTKNIQKDIKNNFPDEIGDKNRGQSEKNVLNSEDNKIIEEVILYNLIL